MQDGARLQQEMASDKFFGMGCEPAEENDREEGRDVRENELAGDAAEGWEAQRDGAGAGHWLLSYFIIGVAESAG